MATPERLDTETLAVTTRSRLKSIRFLPSMLRANARIKRQLAATEGSIRFASVITNPTEFWTISVWRNRHSMQEFVRTGEHEDLMWNFSRWFRSFWLMRWSPGLEEEGSWTGLHLSPEPAPSANPPEENDVPKQSLASIPQLFAAVGSEGAASYANAPEVRRKRMRVAGCVGAMIRIQSTNARETAMAVGRLRALKSQLNTEGTVLGCAIGGGAPLEAYGLIVFRSSDGWIRFRQSQELDRLRRRWEDNLWCMRWNAEHEFGHWDGLRFRHSLLGER